MKRKFRMYYYRLTAKLIDFKNFIINTYNRLKDSPYSIFYSLGGILLIFFVIYGIVSLSGKPDKSNTAESETPSTYVEAMAATTFSETTTNPPTSAETTNAEETTAAPQLIDISQIPVSNVDLSEPVNKNNAASNDDMPSYVNTTPTVSFSPNDYSSVIYGIDVSKWQGNIDWKKVYDAGYKFVFVKVAGRGTASSGSLYYDDKYKENIEGAISAGLNVGVYIFSQAITEQEALQEASLVIDAIKGYNITYPVVFDWETGYHSNGSPYRSNGAKLSNSQMTNIVNTFINAVEGAGYEAMVYGNAYDLSLFDINSVAKTHKVWYARYWSYYRNYDNYFIPGNETPVTSFPYQIWQYKDTGIVPGIPEKVDMNVAFITSTINISVKAEEIYVKTNSQIDLLSNVTAKSSSQKDVTDYVTYKITDKNNKEISLAKALSATGEYTVTYSATYLSEISNIKTVKLIVRNLPLLTANYSELTFFTDSDSEEINSYKLAVRIMDLIENNITTATDCDNKNILDTLKITLPSPMFLEDESGNKIAEISGTTNIIIKPGVYNVTYKVTDYAGFEAEKKLTLNLVELKAYNLNYTLDKISDNTFIYTLETDLRNNLNINNSIINIIYDDTLANKLSELKEGINTFEADNSFTVRYTINSDYGEKIIKSCTISVLPCEETTTESETIVDNTETTTESETTVDNTETTTTNELTVSP